MTSKALSDADANGDQDEQKLKGPGEAGRVAKLIAEALALAGYTITQLAELSGVPRPVLSKAKSGRVLPTLSTLAKVAEPLEVPMFVMMTEHARDDLRDDPKALAKLEEELKSSRAYVEALTHFYGLRMEELRVAGTVLDDGSLNVRRLLTDCVPTRTLSKVAFKAALVGRDPGTDPPSLAISGTLDHTHRVKTQGGERTDEIHFPKAWLANSSAVTFDFNATYHRAYAQPTQQVPKGSLRVYVRYLMERVVIAMQFPEGYTPRGEPEVIVHFDTYPLDPSHDTMTLEELNESGLCKSASFDLKAATLTIERPLPGFTFGIRWTPPEGWKFQGDD